MKKYIKGLIVVAVTTALVFTPILPGGVNQVAASSSLEQQLAQIERDLAAIRNQRGNLQSQVTAQRNQIGIYSGEIGKLRGEMESLQLEIAELELQIEELNVSIEILQEEIKKTEEEISLTKEAIETLEDDAYDRLVESYMDYRVRRQSRFEFFSLKSRDVNSYFKDSQYRQIVQSKLLSGIEEVVALKVQLERDQRELNEKSIVVMRDKAIVDERKVDVEAKQKNLKGQIDKYYGAIYSAQGRIAGVQNQISNMTQQEAQKQAEAERIRQQLFNSFRSLPNGTRVLKGTVIGRQGATGLATGPHVHFSVHRNGVSQNPCNYIPSGVFGNCGGNGQLSMPLRGNFHYTSGYGQRCISSWGYCSFHAAIDLAHSIWNAPVYATHDGWLTKGVDQYGGLYIIICENKNNCNSGFKTGYWHFSSY